MLHKYPKLFTDPKIDDPIYDLDLDFADYITKYKKIIANVRIDLTENTAEKIIEANAPFELRPSQQSGRKYGALLIHGLFDSPFHLRDIGNYLRNQGILVRSILLPGHGTVPGALLHVDYHQWLQAVHYGIHSLRKEVDDIFLVGDSTGATLALYQEKQNNPSIAGIILFSPAFKIRSTFAPLSSLHKILAPCWPRAAWLYINASVKNYVKYTSIPFNAIYQVYRLAKEFKKNQKPSEPACPLFFMLSADDKTVSANAIVKYFHLHQNPQSRLLLYTNLPNNFDDSRIIVRHSAYPEMRIINFSHICLPIPPSNEYYGIHGKFSSASHVKEPDNMIYGEFTKLDLKLMEYLSKTNYRRLTFNPDFAFMTDAMYQFIKSICNDMKGIYVGNHFSEYN